MGLVRVYCRILKQQIKIELKLIMAFQKFTYCPLQLTEAKGKIAVGHFQGARPLMPNEQLDQFILYFTGSTKSTFTGFPSLLPGCQSGMEAMASLAFSSKSG